jgi:signal transduction histidine kinase
MNRWSDLNQYSTTSCAWARHSAAKEHARLVEDSVARDVAMVARIDAIPSILEIVCQSTGLRFAAVARVTETRWMACAVRDEIAFGLEPGGELDLKTTICDEIRDSGTGVVIDHVAEDALFRNHHTPAHYGFQSYISMPILLADGSLFGTLCALDPLPVRVSDTATVTTFQSFAKLIGRQLDAQRTQSKSEQALEAADRDAVLREQFIAILGHDLRNPVAAIQAGTHLLGKETLSARSQMLIEHMQMSCQRMAGLINDLLDFARGRLGAGLVLSRKRADGLEGSLEQVITELQLVHPDRKIDVMIDLRAPVVCDIGRMTQLLSNLLANALIHGDPAAPVEVIASSANEVFTLAVANGGTPIPEETRSTLFQPFTQTQEGTSANGLGLGLYIASEIAKAHDGTLAVLSDQGETRFTLTMPCVAE